MTKLGYSAGCGVQPLAGDLDGKDSILTRAAPKTGPRRSHIGCANRETEDICNLCYCGLSYAALSQPKGDRLELSSSTAEIRDICEKRGEATAKLGYAAAMELARVLADIEAFESFAEFEAMFGPQISDRGEAEKYFQMKTGPLIVFRSGHPRNLGTQSTPTDWSRTTRLMITAIETTDA